MNIKPLIFLILLLIAASLSLRIWQKNQARSHENDLPKQWSKLELDLNDDGKEDNLDLAIAKSLLGEHPSSENNQVKRCDLDHDGEITDTDIYYFNEMINRNPRF